MPGAHPSGPALPEPRRSCSARPGTSSSTRPGPTRTGAAPGEETPPEILWEILQNLNSKALREQTATVRMVIRACRTVALAQAQPTYTALRGIMRMISKGRERPSIDASMVRESRRLKDSGQHGQRDLNHLYFKAAALLQNSRSGHLRQMLDEWDQEVPSWTRVLELTQATPDPPKQRKPRARQAPDTRQLQEALDQGPGLELAEIMAQALQLTITQEEIGLRFQDPELPPLILRKTPSGALQSLHPLWQHSTPLPDPRERTENMRWGHPRDVRPRPSGARRLPNSS